ncbi:MAG: sugar ABC transporter permease [Anaerolineales bacterium]
MATASAAQKGWLARMRGLSRGERRENAWGWLLASPWIIGFLGFTLVPMVASLYLSMTDWDILTTPKFTGLKNYSYIFTGGDPVVLKSFGITTYYSVVSVPLRLALGLLIALLMNQNVKGIFVFRSVYYLPAVLSGVAVAMMWRWIFNSEFGLLNYALWALFRIQGPAWLINRQWVVPALIIMSLWDVGSTMLIYLAGLQGIPTDLYEAATVDGANSWHKFWKVTLPMLSPVIFFNLVNGIIGALQTFTQAYILTEGGPNNASMFTMLYMYLHAFRWFNMGFASAIAWLLFVYILILTVVVFRSSVGWVHYEGELRRG